MMTKKFRNFKKVVSKRRLHEQCASLTIEATVIIPLFLIFMLTLLSFVDIYMTNAKVEVALNESAKELSQSSYLYNLKLGKEFFEYADLAEQIAHPNSPSTQAANADGTVGKATTTQAVQDEIFDMQDQSVNMVMRAQLDIITSGRGSGEVVNVGPALANLSVRKHLQSYDEQDLRKREANIDKTLKAKGVVGGFSGLDFKNSVAFIGTKKEVETGLSAHQIALLEGKLRDQNVSETNVISGDIATHNNIYIAFLLMHDKGVPTEDLSCQTKPSTYNGSYAQDCLNNKTSGLGISCSYGGKYGLVGAWYKCEHGVGIDDFASSSNSGNRCILPGALGSSSITCTVFGHNYYLRQISDKAGAVRNFIHNTLFAVTTGAGADDKLRCSGGKLKLGKPLESWNNLTEAQKEYIKLVLGDTYTSTTNRNAPDIDHGGNRSQIGVSPDFAYDATGRPTANMGQTKDENEVPICTQKNNTVIMDNIIDLQADYTMKPWSFLGVNWSFNFTARAKTRAFADPGNLEFQYVEGGKYD